MPHSKKQSSIGEAKGRGEQGRFSRYGLTVCLNLCPPYQTKKSEVTIAAALSHGTARPQRDTCTTVSRPTEGSRKVEQPLET